MFTVDLSMERVEANNETEKKENFQNLSKSFERFVKFCKVMQTLHYSTFGREFLIMTSTV